MSLKNKDNDTYVCGGTPDKSI